MTDYTYEDLKDLSNEELLEIKKQKMNDHAKVLQEKNVLIAQIFSIQDMIKRDLGKSKEIENGQSQVPSVEST